MVRSVRDRFDLALPGDPRELVERAGVFPAMIRSSSRFPADRTLAKDSVEVNQTFGSLAATRHSRRAEPHSGRYSSSREAAPGNIYVDARKCPPGIILTASLNRLNCRRLFSEIAEHFNYKTRTSAIERGIGWCLSRPLLLMCEQDHIR